MRYFLEVAYRGTHFSGFQSQINTDKTIQQEIEKAIMTLVKEPISCTGSSRTDAGVHALQNYFHFDISSPLHAQFIYKMNAILPDDIVVKSLKHVADRAHCRFDAISRTYRYYIYNQKDPFLKDRAFYFPYRIDQKKMQQAASLLLGYTEFTSFSKRNTQVKTFDCKLEVSEWKEVEKGWMYEVKANRFLRGMVRALTATMLKVGRESIGLDQFRDIIEIKDCTRASFAVPAHGLFLLNVEIDEGRVNSGARLPDYQDELP